MLKPGGNVDSWCGKCKMVLAHTIEAMVGDKPARVHCNTCKAQHNYKAHKPGEASGARAQESGASPGPQTGKGRGNRFQTLLKGKDVAAAKHYSPSNSFALGDVVAHPSFGVGVTTALRDGSKIEVVFEVVGLKVLVHQR